MSGVSLAARYVRRGEVDVSELAVPDLGPGEVEVAPAFTGICGTDLHIYHGDMDARVSAPQPVGHEMSGRVVRVGPGVEGWAPGDPVTVMPLLWDGTCPSCLAGNTNLCHHLTFVGIDAPGSMQSRWVVPASILVPLPAGLPLDVAALVEPTAVAVHDVRRAQVVPGERVLVVGSGPVGLLIAVVARRAGAEVRVVEPNADRRTVATGIGLDVLDPGSVDVAAEVDAWTQGAGADVAFEVSGAAAGIDTAVAALRTRGRLCLVAIHPQRREVDLHRFFWRELTLVGARLYRRDDVDEAVRLVASGDVPARELISRVVPLREAGAAFEALGSGAGVMKVLVACQDETEEGQQRG